MPVELQFIDANGNDVDLATGVDFGMSRKGVGNISKFKIKNVGDITARDMLITATTLNDEGTVDEEEYNRQVKATKWKSFSLDENGNFVKTLNLGSIKPNKFVEGEKEIDVPFTSAESCNFKEIWTTGITEFKANRHVFTKLDGGAKGQVAKRMGYLQSARCRDVEVELHLDFNCTIEEAEDSQPFIGFPMRINSKGDGKGYMFIMHYRRKDSKFMVSIYKHAKGMVTNMDRDYGTKIFDTIIWHPFDKTKKMTFKLYNNALGQPTFEVKHGGQNIKLGKAFVSGVQGNALSDTAADAYTEEGNFYKDISLYDGDFMLTMENMAFKTEELEQFVYVRTLLGDDAEDKVEYKSSAIVSYIED